MSGVLAKVLRDRGLRAEALAAVPDAEKAGLLDSMLADATAMAEQNREFARMLERQLCADGDHVRLSDQADGLGCFYGTVRMAGGGVHRVDVLPPLSCGPAT